VAKDQYERDAHIVAFYIDAAKSYSQTATAALAVSVFVAGDAKYFWPNLVLVMASAFFLIAVLGAIVYQALAVGRLEQRSGLPLEKRPLPEGWYENAYISYNVMICTFFLGATSLLAALILKVIGP